MVCSWPLLFVLFANIGTKLRKCLGKYWFLQIWESSDQKILGVNIDRNLKFNHYILKQCKKAGRKLSALTRICKFMSLRRRRVLMRSFIESQFVLSLSMDVL